MSCRPSRPIPTSQPAPGRWTAVGSARVEALQILQALTRERYGWKHHPAVRVWTGYEQALACYAIEICAEWVRRSMPTAARRASALI